MIAEFSWEHFWIGFAAILFIQWFALALLLLRYRLKHPRGCYLTGYYYEPRFAFFRVWGFGLSIRDVRKWPLNFSERNGHINFIVLRNWLIKALCP